MAKIAVDLDSTLYDFETPAREAFLKLAEKYDKSLFKGAYDPWTQWRSPADALGLDIWLEAVALCHDAEVIRQQEPFAGAPETCQALVDEGHELMYISNRATESLEATTDWLWEHGFMFDGTPEVVCMMEDKKPYLADCQYLIDDRPKTCMDFIYDFDWEQKIRQQASRIRTVGPDEDSPLFPKHQAELEILLDEYYDGVIPKADRFAGLDAVANEAAEEYISKNRRRAFMKSYPYNQNFTDIPHVYLAPTWAGLNYYMVGKGLLSKPAHTALEIA